MLEIKYFVMIYEMINLNLKRYSAYVLGEIVPRTFIYFFEVSNILLGD